MCSPYLSTIGFQIWEIISYIYYSIYFIRKTTINNIWIIWNIYGTYGLYIYIWKVEKENVIFPTMLNTKISATYFAKSVVIVDAASQ